MGWNNAPQTCMIGIGGSVSWTDQFKSVDNERVSLDFHFMDYIVPSNDAEISSIYQNESWNQLNEAFGQHLPE